MLLWLLLFAVAVGIWISAGRRLTLAADAVSLAPFDPLPVTPIRFDQLECTVGEWSLTGMGTGSEPRQVRRVGEEAVFYLGRIPFALGAAGEPRQGAAEIIPAPGDELTFSVDRSRLPWPTPFEMNFMTGHSPSWKRYLYYRFRWRKADGSELRLLWRYEQWHYPAFGWTSGTMTGGEETGLLAAEIVQAPGGRPGS